MSVPGPGADYSGGYIRTSGAARTASGDDYDDLYKVCLLRSSTMMQPWSKCSTSFGVQVSTRHTC